MTDQQILEKAIRKAIDGGWLPYFAPFDSNMTKDNILVRFLEGGSSVSFDYEMRGHVYGVGGYNLEPYSIIFNHDFAKALWGESEIPLEPGAYVMIGGSRRAWRYHLMRMVVADDPIRYLGENI